MIHLHSLKCSFDVIAITENWLNSKTRDTPFLAGYQHECMTRNERRGGGVSIFIKDNLSYELCDTFSVVDEYIECVVVKIKLRFLTVTIACDYRPPNTNVELFLDKWDEILYSLSKSSKSVYILRDFNLDLLNYHKHKATSSFINTSFSRGCVPLIKRPTRITNESATLIDNIITNCISEQDCISGIIPTDFSDHLPIFHIACHKKSCNNDQFVSRRDINQANVLKFIECMRSTDWSFITDCSDSQTAYTRFQEMYLAAYNVNMPIRRVKCRRPNRNPWLSTGILTSVRNKNRMYKLLRCCGKWTLSDEVNYKNYRNKLNMIIRAAEKMYYKNLLNINKHNLCKTWQILNQVINKNKCALNKTGFHHNGSIITDENDICNKFNDFFLNIGMNLTSKIPNTDIPCTKYLSGTYTKSIFMSPTSTNEVDNIISTLKNSSSGHDGIDAAMLKTVKAYIIIPLTHICNLSLSNSTIPHELKIARVTPIFKSGNVGQYNNYRPISVLPTISKILEKIVYSRLLNFLDSEHILYNYQLGFRKNRSTQMALSILVDRIQQCISKKQYVIGTFIDLSKAFDLVNHKILLKKLYHYGIRGHALEWINNYLTDRTQYVVYNNGTSHHGTVSMGVPQGSILGPLLFLIYINDLPNVSNVLFYLLFADDTNIFISGQNIDSMCEQLNLALSSISQWFISNKLLLNVTKTNLMVFTTKNKVYDVDNVKVTMDGIIIKQTRHTKFLGVILDENLTWNNHIEHVQSKLNKTIGILYRARNRLDPNILKLLYISLVYPYLSYCILIWGHTHKTYLTKLFISQKKIIRIITFSDYYAHTNPLFTKLKLMKLREIYSYFMCIFFYKYINSQLPNNIFDAFFTLTTSIHDYKTRHHSNLRPALHNTKASSFCIRVQGPKIWNSIPQDIKDCKLLNPFKYKLKNYLLATYQKIK